jgi:hypothetical protein
MAHVVSQVVPPRRRRGPKRRLREWGSHLRLFAVLTGRKHHHLACLDLPLWSGFPIIEVERCRARLCDLGLEPGVIEKLMENIAKRIDRQRHRDEAARKRALNSATARRMREPVEVYRRIAAASHSVIREFDGKTNKYGYLTSVLELLRSK